MGSCSVFPSSLGIIDKPFSLWGIFVLSVRLRDGRGKRRVKVGRRGNTTVKMSIQYEVEQLADSYGVADSFPKDFDYGEEEADIEGSPVPSDSKPRILLMGLRRSGKSSIQKVSDM